jgi:hypothetical protein
LTPDSPLVVEVLVAFEVLTDMFAADLAGEADFVAVDPQLTTIALKAARDAIAAAYARPVLTCAEHERLLRPRRRVLAWDTITEPDLGPHAAELRALLSALAPGHRWAA